MLLKRGLCLLLLFACCMVHAAEQRIALKLVMPNFPPYTYQNNHRNLGLGVNLVKNILPIAGINYSIKMVQDYGLAVYLLKTGKADGMFLASQNSERDKIAVFTKPLMINRWSWYLKSEKLVNPHYSDFIKKAKIGTILNTNTHKWLQQHGYHVYGKPANVESLHKMLQADRINAVFIAETVFENSLTHEESSNLRKIVEVEKPFGIYISKRYLQRYPDTVSKINKAIKQYGIKL